MLRFKDISDCSNTSIAAFLVKLSGQLAQDFSIDESAIYLSLSDFLMREVAQLRAECDYPDDLPVEDLTFKAWVALTRKMAKHLKQEKILNINGSKLLNIVAMVLGYKTTHVLKSKCEDYKMVVIDPVSQTVELKAVTQGLSNLYQELGCDYIEALSVDGYTFMFDENAKFKPLQPAFTLTINNQSLTIIGKAIICRNNEDGDYENIGQSEFDRISGWLSMGSDNDLPK